MNHRIKYLLVMVVSFTLLIPLIQRKLNIVSEPPLGGKWPEYEAPKFAITSWLSGEFQDQSEEFEKRNIGFRNTLIRMKSQFFYSIFNRSIGNGVIVGKNNFIFDREILEAAMGKNLIPADIARERMKKLSFLQKLFERKGIHFMLVLSPAKADVCTEHLPKGYESRGGQTNYTLFSGLAKEENINTLDLFPVFESAGKQYKYPLFPSGGIHFSEFASMLVADTLIQFIESKTGKNLPSIEKFELLYPEPPHAEERDVADGMNLLFPLEQLPLAHPVIQYENTPKELSMLTIADSYYWNLYTHRLGNVIQENYFWFYFNEFHNYGPAKAKHEVDLFSEIEKQDVIMILCNHSNLPELGWGFIEDAYELYTNPQVRKDKIRKIEAGIRKDPNWMKTMEEKAEKEKIPLDSMIHRDAEYVFENQKVKFNLGAD